MNNKRLGIGFIGGGFITRFHIQSLLAVRDVDVIGVMSKTLKSAEESADLANQIGVGDNAKAYKSITDMIADPKINALWVCSPNFARIETFEEIANAISSGKGQLIGVTCEKPLGRNFNEAKRVLDLTKEVGLLDGYLENQVFSPSIVRGKEIIWSRGAGTTGRPYLARAAEEHSGPHMPWFWEGSLQGGGVLNDMMCHSVEEARFMLTDPSKPRDSVKPISISAHMDCLKWQRPEYAKILSDNSNGKTDYLTKPSEDFARSLIEYLDEENNKLIVVLSAMAGETNKLQSYLDEFKAQNSIESDLVLTSGEQVTIGLLSAALKAAMLLFNFSQSPSLKYAYIRGPASTLICMCTLPKLCNNSLNLTGSKSALKLL